jgi:hypothetical protein
MISRTTFCSAYRSDPVDLAQAIRLCLDHIEYFVAEDPDQLLRVDRADAADHAGREILFDTVDRGWRRSAQEPGLELLAMGAIVHPFSRRRDPLAGGNACRVADHRHEVAMAAGLRPQHAEAILGIVESDALDEASQHFLRRGCRRCLHGVIARIFSKDNSKQK